VRAEEEICTAWAIARDLTLLVLVLELAVQDVDGRFHLPALPRRLGGGLAL